MSTIIQDMYGISLINDSLTDIRVNSDNDAFSGYNQNGTPVKIPGGIVNAIIKIFLSQRIGIGVSEKGEIYTEIMGNKKDEIIGILFDPKERTLKACTFMADDVSSQQAYIKAGMSQIPFYLMIPYMVHQRIQNKYKDLNEAWDAVFMAAEESGFRNIEDSESAEIIIDAAVIGAENELPITIGKIGNLGVVPGQVYDYTPELLCGKAGTFTLSKAVPKPADTDPFSSDDSKTYQEQMKQLKDEVWPLVKDYYEGLSDEDKALVPDENRLGIYIPTPVFINTVKIIADGLKNHEMDSQNVLLKGPPGVGKSVMAVALAYVFSMPYRFTQSYKTADASEYIGTTVADNGILKTNIETQFAQTVMRGGVHMDDDNNYAAEGEGTVKNSILIAPYTIKLADGTMAKRHPFSIFMMSANPDMKGARPINEAYSASRS